MINIENNARIASDLDVRIVDHISRGNKEAYNIICLYHMDEIIKIRNYMMDLLRDCYYDARMLNQCFHMAVAEFKINLQDLLVPGTKVVSEKQEAIKLAM